MPVRCCVPDCDSQDKRRYVFPIRYPDVMEVWISRIKNPRMNGMTHWEINRKLRICGKHFSSFCFKTDCRRLPYRCLPTIALPGFHDEPTLENSFAPFKPNISHQTRSCRFISNPISCTNDGYSNTNFGFLKDTTNLVSPIQDTIETEINIRDSFNKKDFISNETNDLFTIRQEYIESITKVDPEESESKTDEGLLLHKKFNDYRQKTEKELKEMDLILGFLTEDINSNGIYGCPRCSYTCTSVNEIKPHLLAHIERFCDICSEFFSTEKEASDHSKLHRYKSQISYLENLKDHQYSIQKS